MGAGLTRKQRNSRTRYSLQAMQAKLARVGVPSVYRRFQLCADVTGLTSLNGFNVRWSWGNMSNGESVGMQLITVFYNGAEEVYGWCQKNGDRKAGVARIVELFSRLAPADRPVVNI